MKRVLFLVFIFFPEILLGYPRIKNPSTPNEVQIDLNDLSDDIARKVDNTYFTISSSGAITLAQQPAFLASNTTQSNVTGDGTLYTVQFTEITDKAGNFSVDEFIAPVTGMYQCNLSLILTGLDTTNQSNILMLINTSNRDYWFQLTDIPTGITLWTPTISHLVNMDAGDSAFAKVKVDGTSKTVDLQAGTEPGYFSCFLAN